MTEQPIAVTQGDREAAADLSLDWGVATQAAIRDGEYDDIPRVQAFARHRLAERERCAKVEEDQPPPTVGDLAAFGASDAACYLYPEAHHAAERAAYCAGVAAHATATTGEFQDMAAALRNTPAQALREAGYLDRVADMLEAATIRSSSDAE